MDERALHEVVDLVDPATQQVRGMGTDEARRLLLTAGGPAAEGDGGAPAVAAIAGSWALVAREGERVVLARTLDRPLRYFLAKAASGPYLVVAERIDQIRDELARRGHAGQFHPTYTRMVPAHHVLTLRLVGCPDPNPVARRWFAPPRATGPADRDALGERYVGALYGEIADWLAAQPADGGIGVAFSGGIDSGALLLCLYRALLDAGQSPSRLKAFTLAVDGGGEDLAQARRFLAAARLEMLGEAVEVPSAEIDPFVAVELIEDYKPLDVEAAAMTLALWGGVRRRYPEWRLVVDGDGGDENMKSYPIEENPELTIRSVVGNSMLYQEGWGVEAIKHSLTYSGGFSRSCVRSWVPARLFGFTPFSPYTRPAVIAAAEAVPFAELTGGSHQELYALKGDLVARGVRAVTGFELPVFPKRRMQHGAGPRSWFAERFAVPPAAYRQHLLAVYGGAAR
ncbi:MAG TPA: asparagine synthase-related protein [Thermoanaerobaculia bacterium]|nr:asparagine synthase-related protein [Thermoanaerobaculia bacterium]